MNENHNAQNEENSQEIRATITNLLDEIIDDTAPSISRQNPTGTVSRSDIQENSCQNPNPILQWHPPKVIQRQNEENQREQTPTYEIYRAGLDQFRESQSDVDVGLYINHLNAAVLRNKNTQTVPCMPPSYSTVIKQGRPSLDIRRDVRSMEVQHISPFTRVPPPSYAEIHGVWSREISNASSEQILLGPDPIYIWCTHCGTVVITVTKTQRSKFTHITAAALCLFGCWPCALLPYCMSSCNNIYHYCPDCNYLFGMYRPW